MTAATARSRIDYRRPTGNPRGSGYARAKDDFYVEPPEAVHALFDAEPFRGSIIDPACGSGTIIKVAHERRHQGSVVGSDLVDHSFGVTGVDFLAPLSTQPGWASFYYDNIVCNPPYSLAVPFIQKALVVARHKVAMLLRLSFLEGQERAKMFTTTPLARVHVFSYRISMPSGAALAAGTKPKGGSVAFAWFVWVQDHRGPATINWLRREDDGVAYGLGPGGC